MSILFKKNAMENINDNYFETNYVHKKHIYKIKMESRSKDVSHVNLR